MECCPRLFIHLLWFVLHCVFVVHGSELDRVVKHAIGLLRVLSVIDSTQSLYYRTLHQPRRQLWLSCHLFSSLAILVRCLYSWYLLANGNEGGLRSLAPLRILNVSWATFECFRGRILIWEKTESPQECLLILVSLNMVVRCFIRMGLEARVDSLWAQYGSISTRLVPVSHGIELGGYGRGFCCLGEPWLVLRCLHILSVHNILSEADWHVGASLDPPQIVVFFHVSFQGLFLFWTHALLGPQVMIHWGYNVRAFSHLASI